MENSDQYTLCWNNFQNKLSSGFYSLLDEEVLLDVTLGAEGQFVQAHKLVLAVCSSYFKQLFKANPCNHPIVILKDVQLRELQALLDFMYKGEVNVAQDDLPGFLKTAQMLQISGLTDSIQEKGTSAISQSSYSKSSEETQRPAKRFRNIIETKSELVYESPRASPHNKRSRTDYVSNIIPDTSGESSQIEYKPPTIVKEEVMPIEITDDEDTMDPLLSDMNDHGFEDTGQLHGDDIRDGSSTGSDSFGVLKGDMSTSFGAVQEASQGKALFVKSKKGHWQLVHNGYIYTYHTSRGIRKYWKCTQYSKTQCPARCITHNSDVFVRNVFHNHSQMFEDVDRKARNFTLLS